MIVILKDDKLVDFDEIILKRYHNQNDNKDYGDYNGHQNNI